MGASSSLLFVPGCAQGAVARSRAVHMMVI
jgi:hypothetical protein